jgi:hypothetical protein
MKSFSYFGLYLGSWMHPASIRILLPHYCFCCRWCCSCCHYYYYYLTRIDLLLLLMEILLPLLLCKLHKLPCVRILFVCVLFRLSQWQCCLNLLRPVEHWGHGFESPSRHGCLCVFILCLCCSVCRHRPCDELIPRPRSPTNCVQD